ncbi:AlwI family type II restriction endonuclease [Kingella kingae]|uniref:AlwI family type II restriction endonuclease n=2 Tax=Kingella kingae TaxID=504 RepID=F5S656_KINKI|nr:AlwI family type II restriction endonuclease [Kingella kingae]EGK10535.1 hypothetical protein HMPREF0476_0689 [Kingella kingae ATCC 23330]MDK4533509.1 AlwI family type II restriction endonuclease [Kingella kingae]MDK4540009.1 AlwI family type II restriction endonuclease [Kingella kingae]MDK4552542.1 AlwI family type II restriction endonuclease [Kingella kingae]UOP03887.1 AlwI family type II restriction endonuclease [Kingella kingae]
MTKSTQKTPRAKREAEYKQMAFETAIRNPERYKSILQAVAPFKNQVLNDDVLLNIVSSLYLQGIVKSNKVPIDENSTIDSIKDQVKRANASRNSDGGFPKGYAARFWTYMRTLSELGFVLAQYGQPFQFSAIANKLVADEISEHVAFAVQAMKYNRRSPYRNVKNDFNFFRFIINVLKEKSHLSYPQFIMSLFSRNGDVAAFCQLIDKHSLTLDNVAEFVHDKFGSTLKEQTITHDYPDVVLRVLILTGFVSVTYQGVTMIELNQDNRQMIDNLLNVKIELSEEEKENPQLHFQKLEQLTDELLKIAADTPNRVTEFNQKAQKLLENMELNLTETQIIQELNRLAQGKNRSKSTLPSLHYVAEPLLLEFLLSLLLVLKYQNQFCIQPNFVADHNGLPISHAPARKGDIELFSNDIYWLIEATLIKNKTQQMNAETTSVIRHFNEALADYQAHYLSFVAPLVHADTREFYRVQILLSKLNSAQANIYLKSYAIDEFVGVTLAGENLQDMREHTQDLVQQIKKVFC